MRLRKPRRRSVGNHSAGKVRARAASAFALRASRAFFAAFANRRRGIRTGAGVGIRRTVCFVRGVREGRDVRGQTFGARDDDERVSVDVLVRSEGKVPRDGGGKPASAREERECLAQVVFLRRDANRARDATRLSHVDVQLPGVLRAMAVQERFLVFRVVPIREEQIEPHEIGELVERARVRRRERHANRAARQRRK